MKTQPIEIKEETPTIKIDTDNKVIIDNEKYNGWTNYATWNAYGWLSAHWTTLKQFEECTSTGQIKNLFYYVIENTETDFSEQPNEIRNINWEELLTHTLL